MTWSLRFRSSGVIGDRQLCGLPGTVGAGQGRTCSALSCGNGIARVVLGRVGAIAYLSRRDHDVAAVHAFWAGTCCVPAVVLDVEERAEPLSVFALSAFNPLVTVGAGTDTDAALTSTLCAFTSAFGLAFGFTALALSLQASTAAATTTAPCKRSVIAFPICCAWVPRRTAKQYGGVVERPLVVRQ